ncbi:divalent metal cation transporter [Candidatus Roizmanbacteria bacterium]|nr:divalent metal cation transporter [Candidatus Roizmanbacteria bacterium]
MAVFGPATITAISDNDAAGVATYSLAGAQFGYSILFILVPVTLLLAVTQEMGIRIALATGKGLGDLIRERYGIKITMIVFSVLMVANIGTIIANFAALKAALTMFNLPILPLFMLIVLGVILFVSKGNYRTNQRIFLLSVILYFSYVISTLKVDVDWGRAFVSMVNPAVVQFNKEYIFAGIAILGTTITPWGQFFVQSYVIDKKLTIDKLKYSQIETYFGSILTNFFSFFMIVATAATLFAYGIKLQSGEQAALAIKPFAGEMASFLFGIGFINAALMGIIIISLTTAYAFSEFFGYTGSLDAPFEKGKIFYGIFTLQLLIGAAVVLLPFISVFQIVFFTQSFNAILLPFIFFFLLKFTNNKELMGAHINTKWYNIFSIVSTVVIILAAIFVLISSVFGL